MTDTVIVALISAGASALVAITALVLNYRGFASLESRLSGIDSRLNGIDGRMSSLETRVHADLLDFFRLLGDLV